MPVKRSNPKILHRAGELRKETTPAEAKLWAYLREDKLGVSFRRQHAIGKFIVDSCSPKAKLVIEVDGSQYLDQEAYDKERTEYLMSRGDKVIRFWKKDVMNQTEGDMFSIKRALDDGD